MASCEPITEIFLLQHMQLGWHQLYRDAVGTEIYVAEDVTTLSFMYDPRSARPAFDLPMKPLLSFSCQSFRSTSDMVATKKDKGGIILASSYRL